MMRNLLLVLTSITPLFATAGTERSVGKPGKGSVSLDKIDHSLWDQMLKAHVNDAGIVNYSNWKNQDLGKLDRYLAVLSTADLDTPATKEGQLAYWINAYNAVTVRGIIDEIPTSSIRNHTAKLWGYNIWKQLYLQVDGRKVNLDSMEHEILRPLKEPRIHFAIVCASIGCPRLLNEAYVRDRLDSQLDTNAKNFFEQSRNFQVSGTTVRLSSILDWFGTDFGTGQAAQLRAIAKFVPARHQTLLRSGKAKVAYLDYDWNLNGTAKDKG